MNPMAIPAAARSAPEGLAPIMLPPTKLVAPEEDRVSAAYSLEFDYDSYSCDGSTCGEDGSSDICRDQVYEGLRAACWENAEGIYGYARDTLRLPPGPIPKGLEATLKPYEDFDQIVGDFDVRGESDYYGETPPADIPAYVSEARKDYYYAKPDAVDRPRVLPYLRGKEFSTAGYRALDGVKAALKAEAGGQVTRPC